MPRKHNEIRIIGGRWRGKKIRFPELPQLRPSPNRVRETLFNWLMPKIVDANCLDLFAGSGALGFEALSRQAKHVVFIDKQHQVITNLISTINQLAAANATIKQDDALHFLATLPTEQFDIIFLDPPFGNILLGKCCHLLQQNGWLKPNAYIYLEAEKALSPNLENLPHWHLHRSKYAGDVGYHLYIYTPENM